MAKPIEIFDSTLRDGAQAEGVSFSVLDKLTIATALDRLGVAYIEAGNPASHPGELEFFARLRATPPKNARLVAFGSTARRGTPPEQDLGCQALLEANTECVAIFGKSWDLHVTEILRASPGENLAMVEQSLRFFHEAGKEVFFDAEHFFDGYKHNPDYAISVLEAALRGGADCLVLCDTNGGSFPWEIADIVRAVCARFPVRIGIHGHNDNGCAVAGSLAAVQSGAVHVQGTFLGFGERCGNANLSALIPGLQEKLGYACIPEENMPLLTETARLLAGTANMPLNPYSPYVGQSAFAHKGGMHIDGVAKLPRSFEHIDPERVGNRRRSLVSGASGRGALLPLLRRYAPELSKDSPEAQEFTALLKELEQEGYQYESAEASFRLLVRRRLGQAKTFYELVHYRIINEQDNLCSALIKLRIGGSEEVTAADGDGPVHAMDKALRKALEGFYPVLQQVRLIDYKVRVLESRDATAASVRVLIQSTDGRDIWGTVGVSTNIIDASWMALSDSMEYMLQKDEKVWQNTSC